MYLFQDTVANNIRFGQEEAPMEKVVEAAKKACCHEFIMALPEGYDTVIGEGGASLSGGEKQRLSIARALIHDPDVVFLDEPYSGLDPHAVEIFDGLIDQQREGRTFVMVSHDLQKGFAMCTHALVLAKGKVVAFDEKDAFDFDEFSTLYRSTVGMGVA